MSVKAQRLKRKEFDRYGPNACKVQALLHALRNLSSEDVARLESSVGWVELFLSIAASRSLEGERPGAQRAAAEDAMRAVLAHGSDDLLTVAGSMAVALVVADRLPARPFESYDYHLSRLVVGYKPYQFYEAEDFALEEFCEQLAKIEGREVYVMSRPDDGGANGAELTDAIIKRGGARYVVEHTAVSSYVQQANFQAKFERSIKAARVEEAVMRAHPGYGVNVVVPVNAFKSDREIERFDFEAFKESIIKAVGETPISRNAQKVNRVTLPGVPFDVAISRHRWGTYCHLIQSVPTDRETLKKHLEGEMVRAVNAKRRKLAAAKATGERTILLLDSEDYSLLSHDAMAQAFGRVARVLDLTGIDEVFTVHNRGVTCWVLPAKVGGRVYPLLPQFRQFVEKRLAQYE